MSQDKIKEVLLKHGKLTALEISIKTDANINTTYIQLHKLKRLWREVEQIKGTNPIEWRLCK